MSDDEIVPMTMLDEPAEPAEATEPRTHWTRIVVAISSAVAAVALAVIASAQLSQARDAEQQRCLQEAQLRSFAPVSGPDDQEKRFRSALGECGLDLPDGDGREER